MDMFTLASFVGSLAFALSGVLAGIRKELDPIGAFIVAMLTANGGGAIRDVLIGKTPAVLHDASAFLLVLAVMAAVLLLKLHKMPKLERSRLFVISDAIGLAAFAITGAIAGIEAGLSIFGVMVLAFITATGGGILRDIMVNDVPALLSSDFYGSVALIEGAAIYALHNADLRNPYSTGGVFALALGLRLLAHWRGWSLPRFRL